MQNNASQSLFLKSRRILTHDGMMDGIVEISGTVIKALHPAERFSAAGKESLIRDVGKEVIMPALVDAHVHINEPGNTDWEGFETATKAAAAGGIALVADMPLNSLPVTTTAGALKQKMEASNKKLYSDCTFYGGLIPGNEPEIPALLDAGVTGIKAFLCHSGLDAFPNAGEKELSAVMPLLAEKNIPLLVHAELVSPVKTDFGFPVNSYRGYRFSRPESWETEAVSMMIDLCRKTGCRTHIVHLSAAEALPLIEGAKAENLPLTVETAPHYLFFCEDDIRDGDTRFKCAPPIRNRENRRKLQSALQSGLIDFVATDHSPAPPEMKAPDTGDFTKAWGGISSLQLLLPAAWTAMRDAGAKPEHMMKWVSSAPADFLGLSSRYGEISPGREANLVIWDPEKTFTVHSEKLYHRHPVTPYENRKLYGKVTGTYLRGTCVFDGEMVSGGPGGRVQLKSAGSS